MIMIMLVSLLGKVMALFKTALFGFVAFLAGCTMKNEVPGLEGFWTSGYVNGEWGNVKAILELRENESFDLIYSFQDQEGEMKSSGNYFLDRELKDIRFVLEDGDSFTGRWNQEKKKLLITFDKEDDPIEFTRGK